MNLRKSDLGRKFVAPSGRVVELISVRDGLYHFRYLDDPTDGLALKQETLQILREEDQS